MNVQVILRRGDRLARQVEGDVPAGDQTLLRFDGTLLLLREAALGSNSQDAQAPHPLHDARLDHVVLVNAAGLRRVLAAEPLTGHGHLQDAGDARVRIGTLDFTESEDAQESTPADVHKHWIGHSS